MIALRSFAQEYAQEIIILCSLGMPKKFEKNK